MAETQSPVRRTKRLLFVPMERPDFVQIFREVFEHKDCTMLDALLYGYIYWLTKLKNEKCFASNVTLAELCDSTPQTITNSLSVLEKAGFIRRVFKNGNPKSDRLEIIPLLYFGKHKPTGLSTTNLQVYEHKPTGAQNKSIEKEQGMSALQSAPPFEIIEDRRDPERERKVPDAARKQYEAICQWAEGRRGYKFVARKSQYSALKRARESDINPTRLKDRWKRLEGDTWRDGFDWWDVFKSFNKKA